MGVRLSVSPRERGSGGADPDADALYEFDQDRILIGRGAGADVRLPHTSVSTRHATIEQRGGRYVIVDHGSTNGTRVQGSRLVPERAKPLRDGDRIEVGAFVLAWKEGVAVAVSANAERTASLARRLLREVLGASQPIGARLVVIHGPDEGATLAVPAPPAQLVIGRAESCDLMLGDADASREHVELVVDLEGVLARDRDSKNGLVINERRVPEKRLVDRDELQIGGSVLVFEDPTESALRAAEQAPDEEMPEPPPLEPIGAAEVSSETAPAHDPDALTGEPELPVAPSKPPPPPAPRVGSAELVVYALAAIVLLASIGGLVLLLRAG